MPRYFIAGGNFQPDESPGIRALSAGWTRVNHRPRDNFRLVSRFSRGRGSGGRRGAQAGFALRWIGQLAGRDDLREFRRIQCLIFDQRFRQCDQLVLILDEDFFGAAVGGFNDAANFLVDIAGRFVR